MENLITPLTEAFPEKHKRIIVYLKNGESFEGAYFSGGSGIGHISSENLEYDFEDGNYEDIIGWHYIK